MLGAEDMRTDSSESKIPKIIHHVWVGPKARPKGWMDTWEDAHPNWEYVLWDNDKVLGKQFVNQKHVNFYWKKSIWHGVADVIRYEILHEFGGFMPPADSICEIPVDELFKSGHSAYCVYENETAAPGLVSPLYACSKGNGFALELINGLKAKPSVGTPWKTTGNKYMQEMLAKTKKDVMIFPSHYFNPTHWTGLEYKGDGPVYARQQWGTTNALRKKS